MLLERMNAEDEMLEKVPPGITFKKYTLITLLICSLIFLPLFSVLTWYEEGGGILAGLLMTPIAWFAMYISVFCFLYHPINRLITKVKIKKMVLSKKDNSELDLRYYIMLKYIGIEDEDEQLEAFCKKNDIDYNLALKTFCRGYSIYRSKTSQREEELIKANREQRLQAEVSYTGLPYCCPSCGKVLWKYDDYGRIIHEWVLVSGATYTKRSFDGAYTLGGATTVFTKEEKRIAGQYKCPACIYTHTV